MGAWGARVCWSHAPMGLLDGGQFCPRHSLPPSDLSPIGLFDKNLRA